MRTIAWISAGAVTVASVLYSTGCQLPTTLPDPTNPDTPTNPDPTNPDPANPDTPSDPTDPGTPPDSTDFTAFVKSLLAQTSDTTEPVSLDNIQFTFSEDPAAFDDVLAQGSTDP